MLVLLCPSVAPLPSASCRLAFREGGISCFALSRFKREETRRVIQVPVATGTGSRGALVSSFSNVLSTSILKDTIGLTNLGQYLSTAWQIAF